MEKEFDRKGWASGYSIVLTTAIWVMTSVMAVAHSGAAEAAQPDIQCTTAVPCGGSILDLIRRWLSIEAA